MRGTHVRNDEADSIALNSQDPLLWTIEINSSPEAQAFVLLLEAAYRDWL